MAVRGVVASLGQGAGDGPFAVVERLPTDLECAFAAEFGRLEPYFRE